MIDESRKKKTIETELDKADDEAKNNPERLTQEEVFSNLKQKVHE